MARAETLDQAAAALDTLLGLHCLLPEEVDETLIRGRLSGAGWQIKDHHWLLPNAQGEPLASMVIHKAPGKRLLSFTIDVPNSPDPVEALAAIVTVCHSLNEQYGAPLIDDSGNTLNTAAIEGIYKHLVGRVCDLTDSGFKPGSPVARTLFS
ncbi:MAG: hypothetical protein HC848_10455 [Limnobacter sp.]|nr:hypothetical protein [Limnobacter sp.]